MRTISAGLLMYRINKTAVDFFLVHPGGPFFQKKDLGTWTIPKGLPLPGEKILDTAIREFSEETGLIPSPPFISLDSITQKAGKAVFAWAFEKTNEEPIIITSNTFELEWPPKSKQIKTFPEIDRGEWFSYEIACSKINPAQVLFLNRLVAILPK
jgi:predicted NUDIX family NTP pyrophosphohydrolase